ncbi:hypothetical protein AVEN_114601-1 [Araneus ventricosus]|uniref:Uncharacterized protein n=1 Tax=Araneus ventricosus TaxID=182803 RepID=A0A4Y2GEC3_ARAVE|nr:hypothetical protein AVEN_114601-1 [Araneus ventricosus]
MGVLDTLFIEKEHNSYFKTFWKQDQLKTFINKTKNELRAGTKIVSEEKCFPFGSAFRIFLISLFENGRSLVNRISSLVLFESCWSSAGELGYSVYKICKAKSFQSPVLRLAGKGLMVVSLYGS